MKFAVLSDIHGNSFALKAILKDIQNRKVDQVLNLGDILYGPIDPLGTFNLLKNIETISISGNQDRIILEHIGKKSKFETLNFVLETLNNDALDYLKCLPFDFHHENGIYLCHGTPQKDDEYLIEELKPNYVGVKEDPQIEELLIMLSENIIVCGHSHKFHFIKTRTKTIINPGSVGLQAYDDDLPVYHKMENFHSNTRYCIVTIENEISAEFISLPYDYESAAKLAEKNKRPDWAKWIRTGRA